MPIADLSDVMLKLPPNRPLQPRLLKMEPADIVNVLTAVTLEQRAFAVLVGQNAVGLLMTNPVVARCFDPTSVQHELDVGYMGRLFGVRMYTDAYQANKVLDRHDFIVIRLSDVNFYKVNL